MNRFALKNTFIKIYIYHFLIKYFYKNKKSKLDFEDRIVILNDFLYRMKKSIFRSSPQIFEVHDRLIPHPNEPPPSACGAPASLEQAPHPRPDSTLPVTF